MDYRLSLIAGVSVTAILKLIGIGPAPQPLDNPDLGAADHQFAAPTVVEENPLLDHFFGPGPLHKAWIPKAENGKLSALVATGAIVRSYDYGAFVVAVVDERRAGGADVLRATGATFRDELDLVVLNGIVIDTRHPEATLNRLDASQRFGTVDAEILDPRAGLYLVQYEGPMRDEWYAELEALGTKFVQHVPMNAYVVALPPASVGRLESLAQRAPYVQFAGEYEPAYRIHETLRQLSASQINETQAVTIQLVNIDGARAALDSIRAMADSVDYIYDVGPYVNVRARLHPAFFGTLALDPTVFQIEPRYELTTFDERQGQIVAGNTTGNSPTSPGYVAWLQGLGFSSSQFTSFSVNVVDDATSLTGHPDLASSRIDFTANPTNQTGTQGGHGFLNANIVAGLNTGTGSANEDSGGYNYGLGIAPWAHVGSTAIFGGTGSSPTTWENNAYGNGARISTNSWGFQTSTGGPVPDYDANSQEFDFIVRDAQGGTAGNQELTVVFSAGNSGSGSNTVSTPGTAKNILTVAAGENDRQTGSDGCGIGNSGANSLNDIISFSSRGPVNSAGGDGRWKPEITAPGTHIQAGIPQSNYNGSSVCNQYWPSGQTLYGWSSGTSHSCPAVAGGAALVRQWFLNQGLSAPSPAMTKAVLVGTGEYMTGVGANDTLPSNSQGTGNMHLGRAFDGAATIREDQGVILGSSGATHVVTGNVDNSALPFRVALVWTDAPGPTSGAPYLNNLDLTVDVGGNTYRGNVFSGANSTTGGSADIRNNTELVFLPAGTSGAFTVTVTAASIGADGVPGNGDTTDQDFALVIYNGSTGPPVTTANFSGTPTSGVVPLTVNFNDLSSGGPTSWAWDFGDGATSTLQNPSHIYSAVGTYTVSLSITSAGGSDTNTKPNYIQVNAVPPAGIMDGSFEGQTAGGAPATPWSIDFGTGHVINPAGGTTSDSGMPSDGSQWLEISGASTNNGTPPSNPGGVTSPPSGGAGVSQSFNYDAGVTLLSFDAAFIRNEAANSSFNDWMSVDITDGSTWYNLYYADTFTPTVGTSSKLGNAITAVSNVSVDLATIFPGSTTSTVFTVTVLTANGSDSIQPSNGYVDNFALTGTGPPPAPTANFTGSPTSGAAPLNVAFSDSSTGSITNWSWTFGDGSTSTAQNPSHVFSAVGTYSVSLTVTGPGGSDTLTRNSYITVTEPAPTASFSGTPTSGTAPLTVSFSDASSGAVTGWSWNFGDGATSTAQNPSHVFSSAGTYTVSLTVTGPGGSDTQTRNNYITVAEPAPTASFSGTPTSGTAPLTVSFSDASSGAVTGWSWDFGDGATSTAQNPSHVFGATGTYTVSLTVTGPGGSDTLTRPGYIVVSNNPPPTASFTGTPTSGTIPLVVNFTDASTGSITGWSWDFGDGTTSTAQNPSHTYGAAGTYTVSLTVTGPGGSNTQTRNNYITASEPAPTASFTGTPTSGTSPLTVSFSDGSTGSITAWSWTFGDGATSTAQNPSHVYNAAGTYTVALTVTGPGGSDTQTRVNYITVNSNAPTAAFSGSPTSGDVPLPVAFSDQSTGSITSWSWNFGDGGTSTAQNPTYTYTTAGTYTVSLTVTGPGGSDTATLTNYIVATDPPPPGGALYYLTFTTTTTVPGVGSVADEDVVTYDPATDTWALYIDGSDVGLKGTDINALHVRADGSMIVSLNSSSFSLAGLVGGPNGTTIEDSDLVLFTPTSTGANSAGSWTFFLDGSDISLTTNGEDIDGVYEYADGSLALSTLGSATVSGLNTQRDEDVMIFTPTSLGASTAGSFAYKFDGSDVGFNTSSSEDLNAVTFNANDDLIFSTTGTWSASGGGGEDEDLGTFTGTYGSSTSGSAALLLDFSVLGISTGEDIDGVTLR